MIKIEHVETAGWAAAMRGMRNPMNSWAKGDSEHKLESWHDTSGGYFDIGPNDKDLAMRLRNAGVEHRKYMRMICVWCDITAPLYWWKQFDTYKIGTVANSCSTMHKIHAKEFTLEDFSCEHLIEGNPFFIKGRDPLGCLKNTIEELNFWRMCYVDPEEALGGSILINENGTEMTDEDYWWQMIELLPNSYNQKRTCMLSYETAAKQYKERKNHKLQEWHDWCDFLETLPASYLITGEEK